MRHPTPGGRRPPLRPPWPRARLLAALAAGLGLATACNAPPTEEDYANLGQVGYRDGDDGPNSGERGTVKISEVLWTGSLKQNDAGDWVWYREDVFVEFRNEGTRPVDMSRWLLEVSGAVDASWRIPEPPDGEEPVVLDVGQHGFLASRDDGCFPEPDWVLPDFRLPYGDAFFITLRDVDERIMEFVGSRTDPPFAGAYDLVSVRSMERIEMMFGGYGTEPQMWHHYTDAEVDVPNNDRIAEACRARTLASPGRPNSPDYSGAFATGSFE